MSTTAKNYNNKIIHADARYCTLWDVALLLSESRAIINDLDVILHGFILQIIYTTFFRVKWLNNPTLYVGLFNYGINITYQKI